MRFCSVFLLFILFTGSLHAQPAAAQLKPGFDIDEYLSLLSISSRQGDAVRAGEQVPAPVGCRRIYRSPTVGLDNRWDFWLRDDTVAVISLRGTTAQLPSWLANFYAAMVPATGAITLNDSTRFTYKLAENPAAMVHTGWLVSLGSLAPTILEQVRLAYGTGVREFIIMGHSQGGAIAFLLRSYLHYLTENGGLPRDLVYKTYCSAAPKPGNMYYAYDYDFLTRNGWGFNVVNGLDWVPETPFTVQRISDFNPINPFVNVKLALKKQPTLVRWYATHVFNKMDKATRTAQQRFQKYLGNVVYSQVKKTVPQLKQPAYAPGSNYMRAGVPIVLLPADAYRKTFPDDPKQVFLHHMLWNYYTLAKQYYGK